MNEMKGSHWIPSRVENGKVAEYKYTALFTCSYCRIKKADMEYSPSWDLFYCEKHLDKEGLALCRNCGEESSIMNLTSGIPSQCPKCRDD